MTYTASAKSHVPREERGEQGGELGRGKGAHDVSISEQGGQDDAVDRVLYEGKDNLNMRACSL